MPHLRTHLCRLILLAGLILSAAKAETPSRVTEITLPEEKASYIESPLPGCQLATTLCLTCHSADYVRTQPVLPRTFWKAVVTKMQKTFGAPIPDAALEPIIDYLAKTYGTDRPPAPPARLPSPSGS